VVSTNRTIGGGGGVSASLDTNFLRYASTPTPQNQQQALNDVFNGRADQKISGLNQLELFVFLMRGAKPAIGQLPPDPRPILQSIHQARLDTLDAVSAWAGKCEFDVAENAADQIQIFNDLADSNDWRHRQVALLLADRVPQAVRDPVLTALVNDPQASVRAECRALRGRLSVPPAAPTTRPTTVPTTMPTAVTPP